MKREVFCSCFYIAISSPAHSNISQNDTENLEKQWQEMQQRHEEKQQLLVQLEEVAKLHQAEHVAQKARRKAEKKIWEKAERKRVAEEKRKKTIMEYLQWLQDEVLEEEAILLEGAERSQVIGSKCKDVAARDKERQRPSKKARGKQLEKYHRGATTKIGGANPCERYVSTGQNYLVHSSR